ncbi:winged helix-turn-helix transcriptional regulator [Actinokineospora globicatena]|uniref:HTH hxlR-type domain-containing protein n=1 Tax=Actinokineospora globicatena TaxID=103729 RepID=A0A9W6QSA0_9PSEU|nr:hypothetical protein Aglo03_60170 [Actinokineospora globicatena]
MRDVGGGLPVASGDGPVRAPLGHGAAGRVAPRPAAPGGPAGLGRRLSDKALTESLRRLLDRGLVERRRYAEAPPRVTYELSALGVTLVDGPLRALGDWVVEHGDALLD